MKRFLKFMIVGGTGTIINLIIFIIFNNYIGLHYMLSSTLSFIVAATSNYIFNKLWVFSDRGYEHSKKLYLKFMAISTASLSINLLALFIANHYIIPSLIHIKIVDFIILFTADILNVKTISKIVELYAQVFGIGVAMLFNFFGNNLITFKEKLS
ncbi:MAG: GtrA family protein [Alphaproteobacteria bacterium]|jgi:putative flippase GtrA|nr:GtrA family protein [Alphaproteobacteria bacterium]